MTISPTSVELISFAALSIKTFSISSTKDSMRSEDTGLFSTALRIPETIFKRSNGSRAAVPLDDHGKDFFNLLVGGESFFTLKAFTAAANGGPALAGP
jgi:hypothetical protein